MSNCAARERVRPDSKPREQDFKKDCRHGPPWIAPGRNEFMSTQRRDCRSARTTILGRDGLRHGSPVASGDCCAISSTCADVVWKFLAFVFELIALAARNSLRQDRRNPRHVRSFRVDSPPFGQAASLRSLFDCSVGYPPILTPAVFARLHRTLPLVPAAPGCRMERYDGKGNLHFKHAA